MGHGVGAQSAVSITDPCAVPLTYFHPRTCPLSTSLKSDLLIVDPLLTELDLDRVEKIFE